MPFLKRIIPSTHFMQPASLFTDPRLLDLHRRLLNHYGPPSEREPWDPLPQFIYSLLSSRTRTEITHEVLRDLHKRFGTWEALRDAPVGEIEDTLRPITFAERKAVQLKKALEEITQRRGSLDLSFLARYRTEKIRAWLERFDGVGSKTSAAVVNFSTLRRRAMCVDSHHLRIMQRLGFVGKAAGARETEERIMEMAPTDWSPAKLDEHHSLVKIHGQECCTKNHPLCSRCPLKDICPIGLGLSDPTHRISRHTST